MRSTCERICNRESLIIVNAAAPATVLMDKYLLSFAAFFAINRNQIMEARTNKRIVVTGATGLIGRELIQRMAERGDYVIAFVRNPEDDRTKSPAAAEYVEWSADMREGVWREKIDGADVVVNLAGAPIAQRWTDDVKRAIYDSRILGTRHIVEAIAAAKVRPGVLVNGSAVGFYGASAPNPVTEASPAGNDFLARLCVDWEYEAMRAGDLGVRTVTLRTGVVLDPEGGALQSLLTPFQLFVGGPIGSGSQPWPWIHREDELGLLLHAVDNPAVSGPLNGAAPQQINNRQFSTALGKALGRPSIFPVPPFFLRILFGEGAVALTAGQKVLPEKAQKTGYVFRWLEIGPALEDLVG